MVFYALQDAANLLAVQNSELLRHLALVSLTLPRSEAPLGRLTGGVVQAVEETLGEVRRGLQWSCDFHKNRLFGQLQQRIWLCAQSVCVYMSVLLENYLSVCFMARGYIGQNST